MVSQLHSLNAFLLILLFFTQSGISIGNSFLQLKKAFLPITVIVSGIFMISRFSQPANAPAGIVSIFPLTNTFLRFYILQKHLLL